MSKAGLAICASSNSLAPAGPGERVTPTIRNSRVHPGVAAALAAAALFGAGTPMAKQLLGTADPWLLAGLLSRQWVRFLLGSELAN